MQASELALIRLDLVFESISGLIALTIAYHATKAYKLTEQKRLSDLSTGFLVLSAGLFSHVIGTWYFFVRLGIEGQLIPELISMIFIVTIAYHAMRIMAYILFVASTRRGILSTQPEMAMLLALPVLIDINMEIAAIIVLIVVVLQSLMNYGTTKSRYALYVLIGFLLILLSHIALIMAEDSVFNYLMSQVFQLLGFLAFLIMLVRVGQGT